MDRIRADSLDAVHMFYGLQNGPKKPVLQKTELRRALRCQCLWRFQIRRLFAERLRLQFAERVLRSV